MHVRLLASKTVATILIRKYFIKEEMYLRCEKMASVKYERENMTTSFYSEQTVQGFYM